ncbi:MAG: nucleotidyltransferase domain-containing protein, partial [Thermoplasmatota archaeon]
MTPLEEEILHEVTPTPQEEREAQADVAVLEGNADAALAAEGIPGHARLQGSVAKGTWLRGGADFDLFLLLDPKVPAPQLEG